MKRHVSELIFEYANYIFLFIIGAACIFPLYYVFVVSISDPIEYLHSKLLLFPTKITFINYKYIFSTPLFTRATGVSAFLSTVGTAMSIIVTSALAYALSRKRMLARKYLLLAIVFTTLFNPGLIPNYLLVRNLGLINHIWALIIPVLSSGWNVLLLKSFFDSIPESLEEAAIIDGCNDIQVWFRIVLPLSLPALATFSLFFAVAYWNTFFNAIMYINDFKKWPLQIVMQTLLIDSSTQSAYNEQIANPQALKMAAVVIATTPIMCVYPFLQKHFAKGVMLGAVKG
ncbi:carbohydrate ABC transporter permease [Paenibacillus roseipurpureus]|uniref:Carbohydrate ABC transporter permease n=1 Tax=Paenibacillus roseopurpureus TaxID=2918901 RepID=A0AA96LRT6_9BACL|nr:carbohydrate ABC transporter permease [Paenibacillus sp. MBLB1832]WNR46062.1 carbohydrate ABC transporter permease [Paenibacillus sp. MBLB1832]